jgi:hypothetical protein
MRSYVVKQGDYLTKLAFEQGFDAAEVWNDGKNAELKGKRKSMDILCPGDVLYLPEPNTPTPEVQAQSSNSYASNVPVAPIRLRLTKAGEPIAGKEYRVEGLPSEVTGTTDGAGELSFEAPVTTREVTVVIESIGSRYHVAIGDLDPHDEITGVRMRLAHLGYMAGGLDAVGEPLEQLTKFAVSAFQSAAGLEITGVVDEATLAALVERHGS